MNKNIFFYFFQILLIILIWNFFFTFFFNIIEVDNFNNLTFVYLNNLKWLAWIIIFPIQYELYANFWVPLTLISYITIILNFLLLFWISKLLSKKKFLFKVLFTLFIILNVLFWYFIQIISMQ